MKEVIEALEGPILLNRCLEGEDVCEHQSYCAIHEVWDQIQTNVVAILERTDFAYLSERVREKKG